jgi:hypothetical protein
VLTLVKTGASVLTAACLVVGLTACSSDGGSGASRSASVHDAANDAQHQALETYARMERASLASQDMFKDTYSDIEVETTDPGTISFTYVYAQQVDPSKASDYLDTMIPTLQTLVDTKVGPDMKATGVAEPRKVVYTYLNADESQLWTHTFE